MARLTRARVATVLFATSLLACGGAAAVSPVRGGASSAGAASGKPGVVTSNVRFADYAGSKACVRCHEEEARTWLGSAMHNMTRDPKVAEIKAPFDGATFKLHDDTAKLTTDGGARFMTITSREFGSGVYRITKVIGGHYREDFAGVAVTAARADAPVAAGADEVILPVSWLIGAKTFRYKGYSVMVKERPGLKVGPVWSQTCIFCHNTPPYMDTVLGALAGPRAPGYQGEVVDPLLPPTKRASYVVTDDKRLGKALDEEMTRIGAEHGKPTVATAIGATRARFKEPQLVELGIGCEACHFGAAEHVKDPRVMPSFEPKSDFFAVQLPKPGKGDPPADEHAARVNRACARCHQVLFSGYGFTWEGGERHGNPGGSHINSGEARDLMLGSCASKISCVDCHDPHAREAGRSIAALEPAKEDALCTRCHAKLASPDALRAHSHHDPSKEGGRCLGCHMPKKNMSLDGRLSRYHRIGSPTDPPRVILDRPIECATCHTDATVEKLVTTMEKWWKRAYDRDALLKLYGSMDAGVLLTTAERGKPHEQALAFALLGDTRTKAAAPILAAQLTNPYPLVRGYAKRGLDSIAGSPVPIDIDAEDSVIQEQARAWLKAHP